MVSVTPQDFGEQTHPMIIIINTFFFLSELRSFFLCCSDERKKQKCSRDQRRRDWARANAFEEREREREYVLKSTHTSDFILPFFLLLFGC